MTPLRIVLFLLLAMAVAALVVLIIKPEWLGLDKNGNNQINRNNNNNRNNNGNMNNNNNGNRPRACEFDILPGQDNDGIPVCPDSDCSLGVDSLATCQQACCQDDLCESAQYREDTGRCLLKYDVGDIRPASNKKTLLVKKRVRFDV